MKIFSLENKKLLLEILHDTYFDFMICNGCNFIIPIHQFVGTCKKFINIHPSLLPHFKGPHPINGALLDSTHPFGATCHYMTDKIDDGPIISQVKFFLQKNIPTEVIYFFHFLAEKKAFEIALERNFLPDLNIQKKLQNKNNSYYKRNDQDRIFTLDMPYSDIEKKIHAFGIQKQGALFLYKGIFRKVLSCIQFDDEFSHSLISQCNNGDILFSNKNSVLFVLNRTLVYFGGLENGQDLFTIGENILYQT